MNDPAESSFGGTTRQLQCFGRIGLTNAGGVDQVRRNGDLANGFEKNSRKENNDKKKVGLFHSLSEEMKYSLLTVCREDAPKTRIRDNILLSNQRKEK